MSEQQPGKSGLDPLGKPPTGDKMSKTVPAVKASPCSFNILLGEVAEKVLGSKFSGLKPQGNKYVKLYEITSEARYPF